MSIGSPSSSRSVVVAAATDVAVLDGIGIGVGLRQEGLVEAGLEDRGDRPIARRANADATAGCGFARMIASHSATVEGPIFSAASNRRASVQKAYRRCALGMCSGIVVW